eukprot:3966922-Prymnesium_polylepis.1
MQVRRCCCCVHALLAGTERGEHAGVCQRHDNKPRVAGGGSKSEPPEERKLVSLPLGAVAKEIAPLIRRPNPTGAEIKRLRLDQHGIDAAPRAQISPQIGLALVGV